MEAVVKYVGGTMTKIIESPMQGIINSVHVKVGDIVSEGDVLCLLEAMKMLTPLEAPVNGNITEVHIAEKQSVARGEKLLVIEY
jgi:biotin carboxyl carrier protein